MRDIRIKVASVVREGENYLTKTIDQIHEHKPTIFFSNFKEEVPFIDQLHGCPLEFYEGKHGHENHLSVNKGPQIKAAYNFWKICDSMKDEPYNSFLLLCEDDIEFTRNWRNKLERALHDVLELNDNFILSLYSPYEYVKDFEEDSYIMYDVEGDYTKFYGTQCMLMPKRVAIEMSKFNLALNLNDRMIELDKVNFFLDHTVSIYSHFAGIPIFTTVPSLVQHVGFGTSGLGVKMHQSPSYKP